jgi:hypothetical protein
MDEWTVEVLMELNGFQKAGHASMLSPTVEEFTGRKPKKLSLSLSRTMLNLLFLTLV